MMKEIICDDDIETAFANRGFQTITYDCFFDMLHLSGLLEVIRVDLETYNSCVLWKDQSRGAALADGDLNDSFLFSQNDLEFALKMGKFHALAQDRVEVERILL
jgi:hypothetical protein